MLRDEYLRRLVDASYIDLYLSGNDGARIYWPWRMQPVHESSKTYRDACESYIVDSSFNKPEIKNKDVLDKAHKVDAEYAVLSDVYQDCEATVDAVLDGLETYDDHQFDGDIITPLQEPFVECYEEIECDTVDYVAVGGLKDKNTQHQIEATNSLRDFAGQEVKIHGLGFTLRGWNGEPNAWVDEINRKPELLDSVDTSSYLQKIVMADYEIDKGEERRSVDCVRVAEMLVRDLRRVSEYAKCETKTQQTQLI
jgi:hypothetical protein